MQKIFYIFKDLFLTGDGLQLSKKELIKVAVVSPQPTHQPGPPPITTIFQLPTCLQAIIVDKNLTEIN